MNICTLWLRGAILRATLLAGILSMLLSVPARAQYNTIRFETLSVEKGLSHATVRAIWQDSRGFLWFGTDDGLNKYDGYTFTIFKNDPEKPDTISGNSILSIYEDSSGSLWVGTTRGLNRFDRRRGVFLRAGNNTEELANFRGSAVSAIGEDARGSLWVGTTDSGLNRFDRQENKFVQYQHNPNNPGSLASNQVTALAAEPDGGLWVGTANGLDYYNPLTGQFTHYRHTAIDSLSLSSDHILALYIDRSGRLWVGTEGGGLNRFNRDNATFTAYRDQPGSQSGLNSNTIHVIHEDSQGRLWAGGRNGLFMLDRKDGPFTRYQHDPNNPHSLTSDSVLSMLEDRMGVIWIGTTDGGLSKHIQSNERFILYQHRPGGQSSLGDDMVLSLFEDKPGSVWVGTMDGGLNLLNLESGAANVYQNNPSDSSSLSSNDVRSVYVDRFGTVWAGTYGGGLNRFERSTRRFTRFRHSPQNPLSLSDDRVMVIYEDRRGNLWVGTRGGGLNLMTDRQSGQFQHFRHDPADPSSLSGDFVRAIFEDSRGMFWVGTYNGISVLDRNTGRFTRYENDPLDTLSLGNDRVLSFYEDRDGVMWIGTLLGGLNRFDRETQSFQRYTEKQGLPNDEVYGILGDEQGNLWLSTKIGLSRFDPREESFRNYDIRDGLQSNEFNAGAYHQPGYDRLYFGGTEGITVFNPAEVSDSPVVPAVVITAFKKFNQVERIELENNEEIVLNYQDNFISFEFAALDFSTPEKNQYAYMLENFNKEWVYSGTQRNASYTNLKGGDYVLRVKGTNKDGVWNESGTTIRIVVVPPIWENGWFISTAALVLVLAAFGSYHLRIRRIKREQRLLEELVIERTQEIERRREVAEGLREILAILNSNRALGESLDWIIQQAVHLTGAHAMVIFRNGEGSLPVAVAGNLPEPPPQTDGSLVVNRVKSQALVRQTAVMYMPAWISQALKTGSPVVVPDLCAYRLAHPEVTGHPLEQAGALLAVPLWLNDQVDGGLMLVYAAPYPFSADDLQTAQNFADHAALAIANARLRVQAEEQAVSAERSRLARDLHDAVTQTLFATSLIAEVLPRLWERSPEIGKQKVSEIRELTRGALAEMRTLLMELRPAALEDVALADLLQQLSEAFTGRARVPVALQADKEIQMPPNVKIAFYRIAQEGLNNIAKHARASQVTMRLFEGQQGVQLEIQDDGIGFTPGRSSQDHFGLGIMEERAQSIGASYRVESKPGAGTYICVVWDWES